MATNTVATDPIKESFIAHFRTASPNGNMLADAHRNEAIQSLETLQIPTRKWEEWKYTRLNALVKAPYSQATPFELSDVSPYLIPDIEADVLVFLNGVYNTSLSSIKYNQDILTVSPLTQLTGDLKAAFEKYMGKVISADWDIFTAINTAYSHEGVFVHLPAKAIAKAPIYILHLTQPDGEPIALQHRNVFVADQSSQATIIEQFQSLGSGNSLRNATTEVYVHDNAQLAYIKLQEESTEASQIDHTAVYQHQDSKFSIFTITTGGKLIRNNLHVGLHGKNVEANLMGMYMLDGTQHVDNHTQVDHAEPHCYSNELYKGVMDESATGVFNGRIHVYRDAQKTNAFQSNRNIILSDNANMYTKPQLEIYADDVKCSHGATTGRLDEDAMFYLRARGLNELMARKLLIQAFTREVIENIAIEPLVDYLSAKIENRY